MAVLRGKILAREVRDQKELKPKQDRFGFKSNLSPYVEQ